MKDICLGKIRDFLNFFKPFPKLKKCYLEISGKVREKEKKVKPYMNEVKKSKSS